jgi:predicted permease
MKHNPDESENGHYNVFYTPEGKKYIVLEGLNPTDIHVPSKVEMFIHERYDTIAGLYWILFAVLMFYLVTTYIFSPLFSPSATSK